MNAKNIINFLLICLDFNEYFNKNTVMFKYGDKGDKFYIILSGIVGIYKPSPKNMDMTFSNGIITYFFFFFFFFNIDSISIF